MTYAVEERGRGSLKQYFDDTFLVKIFKMHKVMYNILV